MGRKNSWQTQMIDYQDDENENVIEFKCLILHELINTIKTVPFDLIINKKLSYDNEKFYGTMQSNALKWFYTADRLYINNITIYTFRFPNTCHPDYYKSFIVTYHQDFKATNQCRHRIDGWYYYTGRELLHIIRKYLNIAKIINQQNCYQPRIFINNKFERLDIEFYLETNNDNERITITFEPGAPIF